MVSIGMKEKDKDEKPGEKKSGIGNRST